MAAIPHNSNLPEDLFTTNRAPTDEELATARALIITLENKLLDPTTETADAGSTDSQNHDLESLAALKTVVSPIRRVGEDIIREVFLACLYFDPFFFPSSFFPSVDSRDVPCTLTHISSGLRQIALSTQALWTAFRVNISKRRGHALLLDVWINHRSGNLPLHIAIRTLKRRRRKLINYWHYMTPIELSFWDTFGPRVKQVSVLSGVLPS